jgi:DNA-binding NtrC family response regulator
MSKSPIKIFVVEDNEWYNKLLVHALSLNPDYEVKSFTEGKSFLDNLREEPDIVTLDYRLPDISGLDLLKKIKDHNSEIQVILISEQDDINTVVTLLKMGVYDYITKSEDIKDRLLNTVQNIRNGIGLKMEISELRREVQKKYSFRSSLIGESTAIKTVFQMIEKASETNINVVVSGETGTGKELVAKAIHYNSRRQNKPLVAVNVADIPTDLVESELFGHEKGAFTGALSRRTGQFEEANGGTLFLDEIAEMPLQIQSKLLRALQEKEIIRIGSNKPVKIDCRIIVASNRNLREEVKKGNFREDLYFRLQGLPIELPPLRDRGNDILILARHFVQCFCEENKIPLKSFSASAHKKLLSYSYPGNIRELKSLVELAATIADSEKIDSSDLMIDLDGYIPVPGDKDLTLREHELRIIKMMLKKNNDDIKIVADKLDIGVSTIYRILQKEREQ